MKKVLFLFVSIFCSFLFVSHVNAEVVVGKCFYSGSQDSMIEKIELEFPFSSGNEVFTAVGSDKVIQTIDLENRATVQFKFRNENHVCPAYIVAAVGNWVHSG